jgi:hypothetical protein
MRARRRSYQKAAVVSTTTLDYVVTSDNTKLYSASDEFARVFNRHRTLSLPTQRLAGYYVPLHFHTESYH